MHWIAVALGGSAGALVRYSLSQWVYRKFPVGTFVVNIAGCFLIGLLMALAVKAKWPSPEVRSFLIAGFLGSLTTFSTFAYQTFELGKQDGLTHALTNLTANVVVGLLLVWLGIAAGELLASTFNLSGDPLS